MRAVKDGLPTPSGDESGKLRSNDDQYGSDLQGRLRSPPFGDHVVGKYLALSREDLTTSMNRMRMCRNWPGFLVVPHRNDNDHDVMFDWLTARRPALSDKDP